MNVPNWVGALPHVNATLNATALVLLLSGLALIKSGRKDSHRLAMLSAFVVSCAFLVCYLVYHWALHHYTGSGSRVFPGTGVLRGLYLTILIPHVVLAMFVPVLALRMIYLASKERWTGHRKLAKFTFPVWVYVSATGVIIYWMLYHMPIRQGS